MTDRFDYTDLPRPIRGLAEELDREAEAAVAGREPRDALDTPGVFAPDEWEHVVPEARNVLHEARDAAAAYRDAANAYRNALENLPGPLRASTDTLVDERRARREADLKAYGREIAAQLPAGAVQALSVSTEPGQPYPVVRAVVNEREVAFPTVAPTDPERRARGAAANAEILRRVATRSLDQLETEFQTRRASSTLAPGERYETYANDECGSMPCSAGVVNLIALDDPHLAENRELQLAWIARNVAAAFVGPDDPAPSP